MSSITVAEALRLYEKEAQRQGVDPDLAKAIFMAENSSQGNPSMTKPIALNTTSPAGAYGLGQVMPATLKGLVREGFLPENFVPDTAEKQVQASVAAIKEKMRRAGKDPLKLAVHYNGSMDTFKEFSRTGNISGLPSETQQYIQKVARNHEGLNNMLEGIDDPRIRGTNANWDATTPTAALTAAKPGSIGSSLQSVFDATQKQMANLLGAITGINESAVANADEQRDALKQQGAAQVKVIEADSAKARDQANIQRLLASQFGANPDDPVMQKHLSTSLQAQQMMQALEPELMRLKSVELTKDPIGWLLAQVQLEQKASQFNAAAGAYTRAQQMIGINQQRASSAIAMKPATTDPTMLAEERARIELVQAQNAIALSGIDEKTRALKVNSLQLQLQAAGQQFSSQLALANFMRQEFQFEELQDAKEADQINLTRMNVWRARQGLSALTAAEYKSMPASRREELLRLSADGFNSIAPTPGESVAVMIDQRSIGSFLRSLDHPEATKFYGQWSAATDKQLESFAISPQAAKFKTREDMRVHLMNQQAQKWQQDMAEGNYADLPVGHPMRMRGHMFAEAEANKDLAIAKHFKNLPDRGAGAQVKDVFEYYQAAIDAKTITLQQAAKEISQFVQQGQQYQSARLGLPSIGFNTAGPTKPSEYPISGDLYSTWETWFSDSKVNVSKDKTDLMNPMAVEQLLMRQKVKRMAPNPMLNFAGPNQGVQP